MGISRKLRDRHIFSRDLLAKGFCKLGIPGWTLLTGACVAGGSHLGICLLPGWVVFAVQNELWPPLLWGTWTK